LRFFSVVAISQQTPGRFSATLSAVNSFGAAAMKTFSLVLFAIGGLVATPAFAADMPVKAPPAPPATLSSWTGFYLGAGGGYGSWVDPNSQLIPGLPAFPLGAFAQAQGGRGGFGTVIAGFDYQFGDRWVAGAYTDFDLGAIDGTVHSEAAFVTGGRNLTDAWFTGARLGYLFTPATLAYATGGYTEARFSGTTLSSSVPAFPGRISTLPGSVQSGGYAGAGIETQFTSNWSVRLEYRYANYRTMNLQETAFPLGTIQFGPTVQTVRADLVYKFGQGAGIAEPPVKIASATWTGFYLGGGGGYGSWVDPHTTEFDPASAPFTPLIDIPASGKGGLLSAIVGYDRQLADRWVVGAYTDYDFAHLKGIIDNDGNNFTTATPFTERGAWFAGGRLGYLLVPSTLAFVAAGYTEAHFSAGQTIIGNPGPLAPAVPAANQLPGSDFSGWYAGGGLETQIFPNWSLRGEYRYAGYGAKNLPEATSGNVIAIRPSVQTFRLDLTYKFNVM
jgi:outer membrane immunogenic protein